MPHIKMSGGGFSENPNGGVWDGWESVYSNLGMLGMRSKWASRE